MGYYSRLSGSIEFDPPLKWSEIKDSPYMMKPGDYNFGPCVCLEVAEREVETEYGTAIFKVGTGLIPSFEDERKCYSLEDDLSKFAQTHGLLNTTGTPQATGEIVRSGEESGDVERFWFDRFGTLHSEEAELRWPDGTLVEKYYYEL